MLSGDRIVMIDPHEKYFTYKGDKTTGYSWQLSQRRADMAKIPDQFAPFHGVFNCSPQTFHQAHYPGTIFRFPLRTKPSEISSTLYSPDRVRELFTNFEQDAHLILLFLKNLESIELLCRENASEQPKPQFKVQISASCLEYVRQQRAAFKQRIRQGATTWLSEPVTVTYPLIIATSKFEGGKVIEKKLHKWMVNEYYAGGNASVHLQSLQKDPLLSYIPLAGTAMPLGVEMETETETETEENPRTETDGKPKTESEPEEEKPSGQIFCFLPLPLEKKSATGLPVHVNGYFSVSQNRRHLKWPTTGQNVKTDKSLLWNQCLLQEVLPRSYAELIYQVSVFHLLLFRMLTNDSFCQH